MNKIIGCAIALYILAAGAWVSFLAWVIYSLVNWVISK